MVMAGGTGGHVFPALAVAESLRDQGCDVSWLGVPGSFEARVIPQYGFPINWISARRLRGQGWKQLLMAPVSLLVAMWQSFKVIRQVKPDVVLGMGGFVTAPGGFVSRLLGLPLVIHEQNAIPGMTNRWLARIASRVLQAFPDSFPATRNAQVTGNPVRKTLIHVAEPEQRLLERSGCRLLIIGGSLGAQALNEIVPEAAALLDEGLCSEIVHQAGRGKAYATEAIYQRLGVNAEVKEFIDDMASAYGWADVIICRAGALTVTELTAIGVAAILVPYPFAVDDHQSKNAEQLQNVGAGIVIQQDELNAQSLAATLKPLCASADKRLEMAESGRALAKPDAADVVADICLKLGGSYAS